MRTILLNPGPVTLSARVRAALTGPDLCHREVEFATLQDGLRDKLLAVYTLPAAEWAATLLTGSGTAAVEAMITSMVPQGGRLLIVENGVYGERMSRIAETYGIATTRVRAAWGAALDLDAIAAALRSAPHSHVAVVHHETTTGRLNNLAPLAALCRAAGARLLLDGVSSFGAEHLEFDAWGIDACAATANKCLHGVPGTAFVILNRAALASAAVSRSVYFDLRDYVAKQDGHGTPFTQSVQTFYALDAALDEFFEAGGYLARQQLFQSRMAQVRNTLASLNVRALLPDAETSCVLHAFELPEGRSYPALHDALKARGFIIYAGQGALSERVFRISAMGDIGADDLARLCQALQDVLSD
jgi:2-aminoethylphosphonate-pyruvate transaminase